ncbi:PREDICTED: uncharacterized protein LOC106551921 [Thamnophis sirtalis]|uniref:Uncharacterized protein LOC106551921 n=1 Tax=Thamnophis sirtalis TaxID=35019 RepID=A0A6I9YPD7_9SAUR|nr:PREDICTED: uncharacterized protein LOC106551921 [Thamnophis sirtalis]
MDLKNISRQYDNVDNHIKAISGMSTSVDFRTPNASNAITFPFVVLYLNTVCPQAALMDSLKDRSGISLKDSGHLRCNMSPWVVYNCCSESKGASERDPAQLSTTSAHPGEEHRKVNQKMAFLTYISLCLLGIFFAGPFFQVEADTCVREWLQNQGNCYAYFDQKLTWHEAEILNYNIYPTILYLNHVYSLPTLSKSTLKVGAGKKEALASSARAHLASILTTAETLLVAEHVSTYQKELGNVWIGLHDVRQVRSSNLTLPLFMCSGTMFIDLPKSNRLLLNTSLIKTLIIIEKYYQSVFRQSSHSLKRISFPQTGKWRWADESTYNYKSWMNYQPDNYGNNEHCVELR